MDQRRELSAPGDKVNISDGMLAMIATVFGGVGLKVIESWLQRNKTRNDIGLSLRDELRRDLQDVREELAATRAEAVTWREKYFEERDKVSQQLAQLADALGQLNDLKEELEKYGPRS